MTRDVEKPWLVVTGGFGRVAGVVVPRLARDFRIHVVDRGGAATTFAPDAVTRGDVGDRGVLRESFAGASAVVHLAANPSPQSPWSDVMKNLDLTRAVLEAAGDVGARSVVLASSVHANGGDFRFGRFPVSVQTPPRPCCAYGIGKAAAEAAARLHHDESGASVRVIRFGLTGWEPISRGLAQTYLADGDAASLVAACAHAAPGFGVYHGVSRFASAYWDVTAAERDLGWVPREDLPVPYESLSPHTARNCALFDPPPAR